MRHTSRLRTVMVFSIAVAVAVATRAGDAKPKPVVDPKAEEVLRHLSDFMRGVHSFRMSATMDWRAKSNDGSGYKSMKYQVVAERPNRLAFKQKSGEVGATIINDGETLFAHVPHRKSYAQDAAPSSFAESVGALQVAAQLTNMPAIHVVAALLAENPYDALLTDVEKVEHVGSERIDSVNCDHLKFTQGEITWQLWIESDATPMITRFESELARDEMRIGDEYYAPRGSETMYVRAAFEQWKVDQRTRDRDFRFKLPRKSREVETVAELLHAYPPHPLLGKKAPKFKLDLVEGGKLDMAEAAGKDIIVLDFWATWCGPCRMALPDLIEVTGTFRDRGVRFVAVNQRETKEQVEAFQEARKLSFPVALDGQGRAAADYGASALPTTVVIGRDGTIQAVHQGYSPELKKQLTEELETLLAGKKLVTT